MPEPRDHRTSAVAGFARTALASMIANEARSWADKGIRINAVGPRAFFDAKTSGAYLTNEPDVASLALHLASRKGRALSGHVFDAGGLDG
jgi:3-oxoacyl-[acyl-carrier protein] reductase